MFRFLFFILDCYFNRYFFIGNYLNITYKVIQRVMENIKVKSTNIIVNVKERRLMVTDNKMDLIVIESLFIAVKI